jgi:hypothetical protein
VRLSPDNKDHTQSGAMRGERRQKQKQIQQSSNEENRDSTLVANHVELLPACSGGPFGKMTLPSGHQYRAVPHHQLFTFERASYNLSVS